MNWVSENRDIAEHYKISSLENIKLKDVKGESPMEKEKAKLFLTGIRVATMGRLAEIGAIKWDIENGKSIFSLPSLTTKVVAT